MSNCSHMYCCTGKTCYREEAFQLKEASSKLMNDLQPQEVGRELGLLIGTDVCKHVLDGIRGLKATLNRQSTILAQALKDKNDALVNLGRREQDLKDANLRLSALREELESLRPAKPKFKVGQIVVIAGLADRNMEPFRVLGCRWFGGNIGYVYSSKDSNINEGFLRAVRPEEI